jgi:hypothetical protein
LRTKSGLRDGQGKKREISLARQNESESIAIDYDVDVNDDSNDDGNGRGQSSVEEGVKQTYLQCQKSSKKR